MLLIEKMKLGIRDICERKGGGRGREETGYLPWKGNGTDYLVFMHLALDFQGSVPRPRGEAQMGDSKR